MFDGVKGLAWRSELSGASGRNVDATGTVLTETWTMMISLVMPRVECGRGVFGDEHMNDRLFDSAAECASIFCNVSCAISFLLHHVLVQYCNVVVDFSSLFGGGGRRIWRR